MLIDRKISAFSKKVSDLPDRPGGTMTAAELKAQFDSSPEELRVSFNGAIDDINAGYATKAELSGTVLGQIPDDTVTKQKLVKNLQTAIVGGQLYAYKNMGGF